MYSEQSGIGKLKLNVDNLELDVKFKIIFYIGSNAEVFVDLSFFSKERIKISNYFRKETTVEGILAGKLENGRNIKIDKLTLTSTGGLKQGKSVPLKFKVISNIIVSNRIQKLEESNDAIHFLLTNFDFIGCDKTVKPSGAWKLNRFSVNIDQLDYNFIQEINYKFIRKELKKNPNVCLITCRVVVNTHLSNREKVFNTISNLCDLLSFAKGTLITPWGEEHYKDGKKEKWIYSHFRATAFHYADGLIANLPPERIRDFLIATYPNYIKYKDSFGLLPVFTYYLSMKSEKILDLKCVLAFILLECLASHARDYFAIEETPVKNNILSKNKEILKRTLKNYEIPNETIEKLAEEVSYKNPTLPDVIWQIMKKFEMRYNVKENKIWGLRKCFIHKGMFPNRVDRIQTYRMIVHFIDRLLLSILGYKGKSFMNIANVYREETL